MQELLTMVRYGDFGLFASSFDSAAKMYPKSGKCDLTLCDPAKSEVNWRCEVWKGFNHKQVL